MIAVPLKTKEETIGVLEVLNKIEGEFDEKNLNFLVTLAPIIAMALDNARMCRFASDPDGPIPRRLSVCYPGICVQFRSKTENALLSALELRRRAPVRFEQRV